MSALLKLCDDYKLLMHVDKNVFKKSHYWSHTVKPLHDKTI